MNKIVYELPLDAWHEVAGSSVQSIDFVKAGLEMVRLYWTYLRRGAQLPPAEGTILSYPRSSATAPSTSGGVARPDRLPLVRPLGALSKGRPRLVCWTYEPFEPGRRPAGIAQRPS